VQFVYVGQTFCLVRQGPKLQMIYRFVDFFKFLEMNK